MVTNETKSSVSIYIDGTMIAYAIRPGDKVWVPIPPGSHLVNSCEDPVFGDMKCQTPVTMTGDKDWTVVVYPT
jgi:hypothetical protein